ncbi:hypothetical protein PMAYCL1PPCAC_03904, partial [Pristionchus mayeri]
HLYHLVDERALAPGYEIGIDHRLDLLYIRTNLGNLQPAGLQAGEHLQVGALFAGVGRGEAWSNEIVVVVDHSQHLHQFCSALISLVEGRDAEEDLVDDHAERVDVRYLVSGWNLAASEDVPNDLRRLLEVLSVHVPSLAISLLIILQVVH